MQLVARTGSKESALWLAKPKDTDNHNSAGEKEDASPHREGDSRKERYRHKESRQARSQRRNTLAVREKTVPFPQTFSPRVRLRSQTQNWREQDCNHNTPPAPNKALLVRVNGLLMSIQTLSRAPPSEQVTDWEHPSGMKMEFCQKLVKTCHRLTSGQLEIL